MSVEWGPLGPAVRWDASQANADAHRRRREPATLIITGFIARDAKGLQTTLGRNGSDFSGSIFGALLDAEEIHIWTDVDGVLSADPRLVPDAKVIDSLSYNEAMELAYFGAKVIHPQTMAPAVRKGIPIWIRNTFAPEKAGTLICAKPTSQIAVKGITCIDRVALVNLEGAGMIGVPGTAHRLFGALRDHGISVILISQGSSEHSICFAIPEAEAARAESGRAPGVRPRVARGTDPERRGRFRAAASSPSSATAWPASHGVAAKVFGALGTAAVSVRAIAQGASERNISAVIDGKHSSRALRSVHSSFYLSPHTISIGLIGPGVVGGVLLDQLASQVAAPVARSQARPARARHHDLEAHAPRRLGSAARRAGATPSAAAQRSRGPDAFRAAHPCGSSAARDHHRLLVERGRRGPLSGLARERHPHRDAEQEGEQRGPGVLRAPARGAPAGQRALPVRGDGRRRPAGHPDAARPARYGR